jgi:hypothetical protein
MGEGRGLAEEVQGFGSRTWGFLLGFQSSTSAVRGWTISVTERGLSEAGRGVRVRWVMGGQRRGSGNGAACYALVTIIQRVDGTHHPMHKVQAEHETMGTEIVGPLLPPLGHHDGLCE